MREGEGEGEEEDKTGSIMGVNQEAATPPGAPFLMVPLPRVGGTAIGVVALDGSKPFRMPDPSLLDVAARELMMIVSDP